MPVVTIAGNPGISKEKKEKLIKEVSNSVAEAYDLPIETVTILIQSYNPDDIGAGGVMLSKKIDK
ncbi:4-oxalocrotonate tautomerase DmpI [Methanobrevibacter boviskoreani]|uniref:4-oxalocrotonate tautomerase DmpI n=1 Tax=Methanobrevibacter boviskoreani TaxID=1348249 RepID=UPI0023F196AC|nr:4-oxalocrotonate tautomerase DmpI [Methanobrevibacter boviskoreani]MDD6256253.1 tautomerase family protein [Methanobrevibacter boviskoreani]